MKKMMLIKIRCRLPICCVLCLFFFVSVSCRGLREAFTWTRIDYDWPKNGQSLKRQVAVRTFAGDPSQDRIVFEGLTNVDSLAGGIVNLQSAVGSGGPRQQQQQPQGVVATIDYQYENNIPMGANVWRDKMFITVPRRRPGVPSTLNYVPINSPTRHNMPLIPYPSWRSNLHPDPYSTGQNIVSVYRTGIDACDRMWFVDTGIIETPGNLTQVQPTALLAIDLTRDSIILRHNLPESVLRPNSGLASVEIDVTPETCGDAYVYIPDLSGYGVIVYSLRENKSWRVSHNYFFVEPLAGDLSIAGHNFQWSDGVFSLALTAPKPDGYRDMYFHALSGTHMYKVSTRIMRNETLATRAYHENDFEVVGDRGPMSQTSQADIDMRSGVMFLNLINRNAVGCWNTNLPLNTLSVVHKDDAKMIYPSDNKVANGRIFVLTNTMPEFLYGNLNYDQINFRVWTNPIQEAIAGTQCNQRV